MSRLRSRFVLIALCGMVGTALHAQDAPGLEDSRSCTKQWTALHPPGMTADQFGRACINKDKVPAPPLAETEVYALLRPMITPASPLVTAPPRDVGAFCPGYVGASPEDRADFWRRFVVEVVRYESRFKPRDIMWESDGEYSIGLLQLSASNARPYHCDIRSEGELGDPALNLACGVTILTHLTRPGQGRGVIGGTAGMGRVGAAHYWSTLRVVSEKPKRGSGETRQPIIKALAGLPACRATGEGPAGNRRQR